MQNIICDKNVLSNYIHLTRNVETNNLYIKSTIVQIQLVLQACYKKKIAKHSHNVNHRQNKGKIKRLFGDVTKREVSEMFSIQGTSKSSSPMVSSAFTTLPLPNM